MTENKKPRSSNSLSERELDKVEKQFNEFDRQVKDMTMDRMNEAPKSEGEMQTRLSQKEITNALSKENYIKPHKVVGSKEKFNEKYREEYEYAKQRVAFIAENNELKGETLDVWTKPFAGMPAEEWLVPTNKPIWGPRYLAEQIKRKYYHRLVMQERTTETTETGTFYGQLAADTTVQRLDAHPVNASRKSVFLGAE